MKRTIDFSRYSAIGIGPVAEVTLLDKITPPPPGSFIIGGANNLLVSPTPPPLVMLSRRFDYIRLEEDRLIIGGAAKSGRIFSFCKRHDIGGFEFLGKLPGTLGGLLKMNAGMKEDEIFNHLVSLRTASGVKQKGEIRYGYRTTDIDEIIFEGTFRIRKGFDSARLERFSKMRANQPKERSAGSVFKNPPGEYAGRLIEAVGLKGKRIGDAMFSDLHANFLVNLANASFEDATALITLAKTRVREKFGIVLEEEVIILERDQTK